MRRILLAAAVLLAGCSSGTNAPASTSVASTATPATSPPAACNLKSSGDIIERTVVPGQPATAQQLGSVNLALCELTFNTLAQTTSTDAGFCTTAAWVSDNPGYNPDAVPAAPLKKIQAQAGQACG